MKSPNLPWRLVALVIGCVVIVIVAVMSSNAPIGQVVNKLLLDSFSSPIAFSETMKRFTPYLIAGLAVFWGLRSGLFNIGVEGQFLVGGLAGVTVALQVGGLGGVIAGTVAGALAGALWALPAAWIKAYRGGHEVISTIMLNQIAIQLCSFLVAGPLRDPNAGAPTTRSLPPESMLGAIPAGKISLSLAIAVGIALVFLFAAWLKRTVAGFELSVTGANATAGKFAGIEVKKVMFQAMIGSGLMAGLGGGLQAVAYEGRFFDGFSAGYGFDSLGVAILAGSNPLGIIPSAFAFSVLGQGATAVQLEGVPKGLSSVLLALLIIVFAAFRYSRKENVHD